MNARADVVRELRCLVAEYLIGKAIAIFPREEQLEMTKLISLGGVTGVLRQAFNAKVNVARCSHENKSLPSDTGLVTCFVCGSTKRHDEDWIAPWLFR